MCRLRVRNQAKRLHNSGPPQGTSTSSPEQIPRGPDPSLAVRGSGSVRQSSNSIQILVVATEWKSVRGLEKGLENQNAKLNFDSKTELVKIFPLQLDVHGLPDGCQRPGLRGRTSTALSCALADGAMDARGRIYEGGPQPLWAAR